jgi:outer membrane protein
LIKADFKYFLLLTFLSIFISGSAFSQTKVGYIDSKKLIDNMQDAKDAKTRLESQVSDWQKELTLLQDSLKKYKDDYEKKKLILTDQMKGDMEKNIATIENSITNYRQQKFGESGEYYQKQSEFMKPVYDKLFKAIEIVAKRDDFDYVFDRSTQIMLLYVNEKYDLTPKVQRILEGKEQ